MTGSHSPAVVLLVGLVLGSCAIQLKHVASSDCSQHASITIAESIPLSVDLKTQNTTYQAWETLLDSAKESIHIAAFYFTLTDGARKYPPSAGGWMGNNIYQGLIEAKKRNVTIRIVQNEPSTEFPDEDTSNLAAKGIAEVRSIDWKKLVGQGILHTKVMIVDEQHVYLGSANMDWRSLAQVKELGLVIQHCPVVAADVMRVFDMYWHAADMAFLPTPWPNVYDTAFNAQHPAILDFEDVRTELFLSSSPKSFCSPHRTHDDKAIVHVIETAAKSICISVMDYSASTLYDAVNQYWPVIDNALRMAAFNKGVKVRLMMSNWTYSDPIMFQFARSLNSITNAEVRLFEIPGSDHPEVPYTLVNHAKYMVSDTHVYVGTSNWSADYFENTAGLSYTMKNAKVRDQLQSIFDRDWASVYAHPLP